MVKVYEASAETLDNYNVEYVPAELTITKAALTVTADNKTKVYGEKDPELTAKVEGLKWNDTRDVVSFDLNRSRVKPGTRGISSGAMLSPTWV